MAIGGSAAHGWVDAKGKGGYLKRAFTTLTQETHTTYQFSNESTVGKGSPYYVKHLPPLLKKDKPNIVVISFGLLDNLYAKTPESKMDKDLQIEINDALRADATVILVTPPVTGASYEEFASTEAFAVQNEIKTAKQIASPRVHVVDLFTQMKTYLASHLLGWEPYAADGWHPNAMGHTLAASLLSADLVHQVWMR